MSMLFTRIAAAAALLLASDAAQADDERFGPSANWAGWYLGAQAGASHLNPNSTRFNLIQPESDSVSVGVLAGYNFAVSQNLVFGLEADWSWLDHDDTVTCFNFAFNCTASSDWIGSLRARLGYTTGNVLYYGTAGFALLDYDGSSRNIGSSALFADSETYFGLTAGVGVEWAMTDRVSLGIEGRYYRFHNEQLQYDVPYVVGPQVYQVQAAVRFKLGGIGR